MKLPLLFTAMFTLQLITGCGGTSTNRIEEPLTKNPIIQQSQEPLTEIEKIQAAFEISNNKTDAIWTLLDMARSEQLNQNCAATDIFMWHLLEHIENKQQLFEAELLRIECALLNAYNHNTLDLRLIDSWMSQLKDAPINQNINNQRIAIANAVLNVLSKRNDVDLESLVSISSDKSALYQIKNELIWLVMTKKSDKELLQLKNISAELTNYITLLEIIGDDTLNDRSRQQQLYAWLSDNRSEYLAESAPKNVNKFLQVPLNQNNKIAVLLPLSGQLQAQAEVIRQGIMAAYFERNLNSQKLAAPRPTLEFVDTGSASEISEAVKQIQFSEFSHVIGPLLPDHIDQVRKLNSDSSINHVYLNVDSSQSTEPTISYFSLSPEQESVQIASKMLSEQINNPVLIYSQNNRAQRMKKAFIKYWEEKTGNQPTNVSFTDNKSMRVGITSALGVLQSEQRIKQLSNLTTETVHSVSRNRRDVDAFVVFADAQQAELINPIIESSISLFGNTDLPVFASSFSYSHRQTKNSLRDLRNMFFLDMPFVQPVGRESALAKQVDDIFGQPSTGFLRLFAFGYDAFLLANNNLQLNTFKHIEKNGLSGKLSTLEDSNQIHRDLSELAIRE